MKLLIVLSVIACSNAAKLDRTYLPPASAATAGGSPGSLTAPGNGPSGSVPSTLAFTGTFSGTPGQSSFGKFSAPTVGQQSVSSFGPQETSGNNQPTGQGYNQPSALGFQTPSSQYKQPSGETGFGKSNIDSPTLAQTPASFGQTPTSFGQTPTSFGQTPTSFGQTPTSFGQTPTSFGQTPTSFGQSPQEQTDFQRYQPERARASIDKNAEILRYDNQNDGETFAYSFETSNGISAEESGVATNGVRAQGGFAYTDDDGQVIRVTYTADENGYQPQGDHLPTPHPIPEEILRSIEQNERAAAAGVQEGAYNPDEDVSTPQQYNGVAAPAYQGQGLGVSQNAYSQPQGQSPVSQFVSPSAGSEISRNTPSAGSLGFQGFNKLGQPAPGFTQSGQRLTQSGYQYSQPQESAQFGRPSASSSQNAGQYRTESVSGGQPQGSFPGASNNGFAPSGPNRQTSVGPTVGFSSNGKPRGSVVEPTSSVTGFGPASGFGQSPSASTSQGSGQYQPSQSGSGASMPAQSSSPYQYNRPGQKTGESQQTGAQTGFGLTGAQVSSTQNFGSPRQPPSFTDEEGYKY